MMMIITYQYHHNHLLRLCLSTSQLGPLWQWPWRSLCKKASCLTMSIGGCCCMYSLLLLIGIVINNNLLNLSFARSQSSVLCFRHTALGLSFPMVSVCAYSVDTSRFCKFKAYIWEVRGIHRRKLRAIYSWQGCRWSSRKGGCDTSNWRRWGGCCLWNTMFQWWRR